MAPGSVRRQRDGRAQCDDAADVGAFRMLRSPLWLGLSRPVHRLVLPIGAVAAGWWGFARYRTWHLRWGATDAEVAAPMPGDDLAPSAAFCATRALTIGAPPSQVWPWLVQVGFGRAGFYSYDWADNLGRRSARVLLPEYQSPRPGDVAAPMAELANERTAFTVVLAEEPHVLVWAKPDSTWAWRLTDDAGRTRLVTRLKARYQPGPFLPVTVLLMEIGDFPMMRRMLLGLAERAEAGGRTSHHTT